jgi:hypothetical protein
VPGLEPETYISPYLPTSPHISPHLPVSPHISPYLSVGEIKYTIDESAAEHAHLLDSPYGDGTYRQEFGVRVRVRVP